MVNDSALCWILALFLAYRFLVLVARLFKLPSAMKRGGQTWVGYLKIMLRSWSKYLHIVQ